MARNETLSSISAYSTKTNPYILTSQFGICRETYCLHAVLILLCEIHARTFSWRVVICLLVYGVQILDSSVTRAVVSLYAGAFALLKCALTVDTVEGLI